MAVPFSNTKLRVPKGFQNILEGLAREVLRAQPSDIYAFGAVYFENMLKMKEGKLLCEPNILPSSSFVFTCLRNYTHLGVRI